jgi:hypothetical protein
MPIKISERDARMNRFAAFIVLVLLAGIVPAKGWHSPGHRLIAELVWQNMSAGAQQRATALLKQHPHYKELLAAHVPAGVDEGEWAFLTAAVWPDMVSPGWEGKTENISKYDVYPHVSAYPFLPADETNRALIENFVIAKPNAETVLSNAFLTVRNSNASPHDRAVQLCWALHLCGDLHQPLHAATLVTKEHPQGDGVGGHHIVLDSEGKAVAMHMFWDGLAGMDESYASLAETARAMAADQKLKRATQRDLEKNTTVASWVQESFRLAVGFAYQEGRLPFVRDSDLDGGRVKPEQIPRLSSEYISEGHAIARQRVLLAAERLSRELNQL